MTTLRVLHVEPAAYGAEARQILESVARVDYVSCGNQAELVSALSVAPYDAVFGRLGLAFDTHAFDAAPTLRYIVTPTTGVDHIDVGEAQRRGIKIVSLRGETEFLETIRSTAEHTFALLLALIRRIAEVHAEVLAGRWERGAPARLDELHGKTLGILGTGRLGRMVAGYGLAFGMRVLGHEIDPAQLARAPQGLQSVSLDELLATSDVLSVHLPLTELTHGFLDATRIARLQRGALLINTARGELIDEAALLGALHSGHLAGAALDVLAGDGRWDGAVPGDHPLVSYARTHHNLLLTPHIGGFGKSSLARARRFIATRFVETVSATETRETP